MAIEVKKREGETVSSFLYRFKKRIQRSGLIKEVRKRQFKTREVNKRKRKLSALYHINKEEDITKARKYGYKN